MDFFNDLSKRFSNVAKSVSEKTRDGVEVTRIANDLRIQKNALEQLYTELGKVCYALRMGNGNAEQAEQLADSIRRIHARIEELTAQRDAIRDVRRCPGCGAVVPKEARFCAYCGKRLPEDSPNTEDRGPADAEYCPDCGAMRSGDEAYCAVCGKSFGGDAAPAGEAPVREAERAPVNVEEPDGSGEDGEA